jgi:hypothetical protein
MASPSLRWIFHRTRRPQHPQAQGRQRPVPLGRGPGGQARHDPRSAVRDERVRAQHVHDRPVRRDHRRLQLLLDRRQPEPRRSSASTSCTPRPTRSASSAAPRRTACPSSKRRSPASSSPNPRQPTHPSPRRPARRPSGSFPTSPENPMNMNLLKNIKVTVVSPTPRRRRRPTSPSSVLDMNGFDGVMYIALTGDVTSGTVLTLTAKENTANSSSPPTPTTGPTAPPTTRRPARSRRGQQGRLIVDEYRSRPRYSFCTLVVRARRTASSAGSSRSSTASHHKPDRPGRERHRVRRSPSARNPS